MISNKSKIQSSTTFNMTPMIDVVFLLIIFFMLVCQFIIAENFEVSVPDEIENSLKREDNAENVSTLTAKLNEDGSVMYAVGAAKIDEQTNPNIANSLKNLINENLKNLPNDKAVINLRISDQMQFQDYKHVLRAVANSKAKDMQLAVFKDKAK